MCFTVMVHRAQRTSLAAITHVGGSARIQTVDAQAQPRCWSLPDAFEQQARLPVLLNAST
jgi:carbamoyltransferase